HPSLPSRPPYQVGGSLGLNVPSYVYRQADTQLYEALVAGEFCYVLNCRQMGKSSLLVHTQARLVAAGYRCATLDITSLGSEQVTPTQWYRGVVASLWRSLGLFSQGHYKDWWQAQGDIPPVQCLQRFFQDVLALYVLDGPLVILIDEIDSVLGLDFSLDDFFALIRFCYNQRAVDPLYERLTFAIFGVATPSDLIQDRQRTPFNIGQAITLQGFQRAEATPLLTGLAIALTAPEAVLTALLHWTGGQPFLTQKLCAALWQDFCQAGQPLTVPAAGAADWVEAYVRDRLLERWEVQDEPEHLRTIRDRLLRQPAHINRLLGLYHRIWHQGTVPCDGSEEETELLLAGLVMRRDRHLQVANPIYRAVFDDAWIQQQRHAVCPYAQALDAWLASQRQDRSRLLQGTALREAQVWAEGQRLSPGDYAFLAASVDYDRALVEQALEAERSQAIAAQLQQTRRNLRLQRGLIMAVSVGCLLTTSLGLVALRQSQRAQREEQQARISEVQALTASAEGWMASNQHLDALLQAIQARETLAQIEDPSPVLVQSVNDVLWQLILNTHEVNRFAGHEGEIKAVAFSPDGGQIASASEDDTVKLWRPDGTLVHTLMAHRRGVRSLAYAPHTAQLASGGGDGTVNLWNPQTGQLLQTLEGHQAAVISLAFHPEGGLLASGSVDGTVKLWGASGTLQRTLTGHEAMVRAIAFSPDGRVFASASADQTIKLWDARTGQLLKTVTGHTATVASLAFSPDGQTLASASSDGTVKLWDAQGQLQHTLIGHQASVSDVAFHPDGQFLVSTSLDHAVRFWRPTGQPLFAYRSIANAGKRIALSPDGRYLVSSGLGEDQEVRLWDLTSPFYTLVDEQAAAVVNLDLSPDGQTLATANADATVTLWPLTGGSPQTLRGHQAIVLAVDFSADGEQLASSSMDGTVRLWSLDGTLKETLTAWQAIGQVAFHPQRSRLAFGTKQGDIQVVQPTGEVVHTLTTGGGLMPYLTWSPGGDRLAAGGEDQAVYLWDPATGSLRQTLSGHTDTIRTLAFNG
ncbi:MAG: AAA-like domain-containing protein, partial [Cyanobacteria bacterium]|nr:AAA-like domain-containing protein [Cyanobacteriota bacterium]